MSMIDTYIKKIVEILETMNENQLKYIYKLIFNLFGKNQSPDTKL